MTQTLPSPTHEDARLASPAGRIASFLVLTTLLPLSVAPIVISDGPSLQELLLWLVVIWTGSRLSGLIVRGASEPLTFTFMLFTYVWFGLAPLAQYSADRMPLLTPFLGIEPGQSSYEDTAAVLAAVTILAFEAGSWLQKRKRFALPAVVVRLRRSRVQLGSFGAVALTIMALLAIGGLEAIVRSRVDTRQAFDIDGSSSLAETGVSRFALWVPLLVVVVAQIVQFRTRPANRRTTRIRRMFTLAATMVLLVLVTNPIAFPRFWTGTVSISILFAFAGWMTRRQRVVVLSAIVLAILLVFPFADTYRRSLDSQIAPIDAVAQLTESGSFSMYSQLALASNYAADQGHTFGSQVQGPLGFFVPRAVWEGKPRDTGGLVAFDQGLPDNLNPSSPLVAELYVEFGWPGVIIGFFAIGRLCVWTERRYKVAVGMRDGAQSGEFTLLLVPLLAGYSIYLLRGSLLAAAPTLFAMIGVTVLLVRRSRTDAGRLSRGQP